MNELETSGIRELTLAELNEVSGGGPIGDLIDAAVDYAKKKLDENFGDLWDWLNSSQGYCPSFHLQCPQ